MRRSRLPLAVWLALVALPACTTTTSIRPAEVERLDGFQSRAVPRSERQLEAVDGQRIAFSRDSKLFLDLPDQRVGGIFNSIQVRDGVFAGQTINGGQVQTPVALIKGASVEELDKGRTAGAAIGVLLGVAAAVLLGIVLVTSSIDSSPGRALRIRRRVVKAPIVRAAGWRGDAAAAGPDVGALSADARAAIAAGWIDAARGEHASVPAFSRLSLTLMALGAPSRLVEAAHRAALDEIEHARMAFGMAAAYSGADVAPGALDELMTAPAVTAASLPELAEESLIDGCLLEGIAAEAAREAAARATDPAVRASLATIARDEATHAELAWDVVRWASEEGDVDLRRRQLTVIHRAALPAPPLAVPPSLEAELAAHGWLAPHEWRDVCERTQLAAASRLALLVSPDLPPN